MADQHHENPRFIHLRTHSEYSIRDGLLRVDSLIERIQKLAMPAVAITDHMNLFALVKFYQEATSHGIKPIVGADLNLIEGAEVFEFTLLCQNSTGYGNLTQLITQAYIEGQHKGIPTVKWEWIAKHNEGLIALSGARAGNVGVALLANQKALAEKRMQQWLDCFAQRFYVEVQRTGREREEDYLKLALELADQKQVPVVATHPVCFLDREDFGAHEARVCIHSGFVLEDPSRPRLYSEEQYLKTEEEMQKLFSDIPEALINSVEIYKRCNFQLAKGKVSLPQFPIPENISLEKYLETEAFKGLQQRLNSSEKNAEYTERLQYELSIINKMGFAGYFLIVADFINWAKQEKIPVGPGRGSGAGSLVAYSLGITELDPIDHELLFERFLNPERISMPDFDIDFCMEGRDRVIDYVTMRYGRDKVSQIITYGTMAAKAVVRDVGRVLGMPYGFVDKIAKLIPFELGITLEKALTQEPQLAERYRDEEEVSTLIDLAKKLEGITRNAGKHAGGVVIAPTRLTDFTPLYCEPDGDHPVTQFDKDDVEAMGLVKFDFLGLRTLTIIDKALLIINAKRKQQGLDSIDILRIPLNDKATFELLQRCATTGVFQLESRGMKDLVRRLKPDSFDDIVALVALFRPGPLQSGMVDDFINRKHGLAQVDYLHPDLESILRPTYGVILYQEQVMQIAQTLAGYSLGSADILRKAMGKKQPEEMAKQRLIFNEGAEKRGIKAEVASYIFDLMEKFAGYGFNKSHSAAYALISYQTAWLKTHYPAEFMAAVLSSDMDNTDKVVGFLEECRKLNLEILPPNINYSDYVFTVNTQGQIQYGLGAIKGVGQAAADHIVEDRAQNGAFKDFFEFCQRLDLHRVNRRVVDALIHSGALDVFSAPRAHLSASVDKGFQMAEQKNKNASAGQGDLFSLLMDAGDLPQAEDLIQAPLWDVQKRLRLEKETLGFYLSGHPLQDYEEELQQITPVNIASLGKYAKKTVWVAGMIVGMRIVPTRTGKRLCVLQLADRLSKIEVTMFSEVFEPMRKSLEKDAIVLVKGKVENDDFSGGFKLIAEAVETLEQRRIRGVKKLLIEVEDKEQGEVLINELKGLIEPYRGGACPVILSFPVNQTKTEFQLGSAWQVHPRNELFEKLKQRVKLKQVKYSYQ